MDSSIIFFRNNDPRSKILTRLEQQLYHALEPPTAGNTLFSGWNAPLPLPNEIAGACARRPQQAFNSAFRFRADITENRQEKSGLSTNVIFNMDDHSYAAVRSTRKRMS